MDQGVSEHTAWVIHRLYLNQCGCVRGEGDVSEGFSINAGVRQGCVVALVSSLEFWNGLCANGVP